MQVRLLHNSSDAEPIFTGRRPDFIRYLVRFGVNSTEAEDITQEVFLRLYDSSRPIKRPERLYDWLLTCARNLAVNRFHRRRREIGWESTHRDPSCDIEADYARRERGRKVIAAIATLDPVERRCVLLRSDGVTFREIGETLNLPLRRVIYLTNMAIEKLQVLLRASRS